MITEDIRHIITWAVDEARQHGRDYVGQVQAAIKAVIIARPDLSPLEIMNMVNSTF